MKLTDAAKTVVLTLYGAWLVLPLVVEAVRRVTR